MSSHAQINANQRNAQQSTGPRTPDGKAAVARNATAHELAGSQIVLPGEDPVAFDGLLETLRAEHGPSSTSEDFLVLQMAQSQWKLLRVALIEQQIMFAAMGDDSIVERPTARMANIFLHGASPAQALDRLGRYEAAARRVWFQALKQLTSLHRTSNIQKTHDMNKQIDEAIEEFCRPPVPNYRTNPIPSAISPIPIPSLHPVLHPLPSGNE